MNAPDAATLTQFRARVIASPDLILDDPEMMQALAAANGAAMGDNIIDIRGIAMSRLEARLDRLESTHRSVIAAAHDNLAGMAIIHRAILRLLEAETLDAFLRDLAGPVAEILRVQRAAILLEGGDRPEVGEGLAIVPEGHVARLLTNGRAVSPRRVTLRQAESGSEAMLVLDLGGGHGEPPVALLLLTAADAEQFAPNQATDLLAFLGDAVERVLRRWL
jgi:uncharacterized protein YigA (DUF484 family)